MITIKSEKVVYFDVDHTLILPLEDKTRELGRTVEVYDSVTETHIQMIAHEPNIRLLLEEKHRGSYVIVWSRGGYEWAANVLRALKLVGEVNLVMSKPLVYYDDVPIEKWLPYRVYLEPDVIYKK